MANQEAAQHGALLPPLGSGPSTQNGPRLDDLVESHMSRDHVSAKESELVCDMLTRLRSTNLRERIVYFYVVDDQRRLVGVVPTRRLLMAPPEARLGDILIRHVVSLRPDMTMEQAINEFLKHRFLAFPVTDQENHLMGVIDAGAFTSELTEIAERRSFDDIFQLIGIHLQARPMSTLTSYRHRFPWLTVNIGGGLACAFLAGFYEQLLETVVILALFIPIVLALAESVSIQSVTLTLHRLHDRHPTLFDLVGGLGREFVVALMLGVTCGAIVGSIALLWKGDINAGMAIGFAICMSMISACILGVVFPTLMKMLRMDPRVAAGPSVLATTDIVTLLLYFNLAMYLFGA